MTTLNITKNKVMELDENISIFVLMELPQLVQVWCENMHVGPEDDSISTLKTEVHGQLF